MITGHFFELDEDSLKNGIHLFRYKSKYISKSSAQIYLAFTEDGVRFFLNEMQEGSKFFSGCVLFLPFTPESDIRSNITLIINALLLAKPDDIAKLKLEEQNQEENRYSYRPSSDHNGECIEMTFLGQLLLDFIFEMFHSTLFAECPMYSSVSEKLLTNHLFVAIVSKAEYSLYVRRGKTMDNKIDEISRGKMVQAERRWVDTIINPRSEIMFHESPWFDDVLGEMDAVYGVDNTCLDYKGKPKSKDTNNDIVTAQTANLAMEWYMSRYRPDGVFRIRFGSSYIGPMRWAIVSVIGLAILGAIYCGVYHIYAIYYSRCWRTAFLSVMVALILVPIAIYIFCGFKSKTLVRRKYFKWKTLPNILMPRLFSSIVAAWMTIGLSDLVLEGHPKYEEVSGFSIFALIPTVIFLYFSVTKLLPYSGVWHKLLISGIILSLSVVYSIASGWALLYLYSIKSYLFGNNVDAHNPQILFAFSMLAVFVGIFIQMLFRGKSISASEE